MHYTPETLKMLQFDNLTATPILREIKFGEFKGSKNVIFGNFRDSEI